MRLLFIGDIFGKPGREILKENLSKIQKEYNIDFTIVNAENTTNGRGLNLKHYNELKSQNIDAITMGNHTFFDENIFDYINNFNNIIVRPYNINPTSPGKGFKIFEVNELKIAVINLLGSANIWSFNNPFLSFDEIYNKINKHVDIIFIDFHAETTSEKIAFGYYVSNRAHICAGTHTHVPTSDYRILNNKCAYITDVGMTGPLEGVIGVDKDIIIKRFLYNYKTKFKVSSGIRQLNALVVELSKDKSSWIKHIHVEG